MGSAAWPRLLILLAGTSPRCSINRSALWGRRDLRRGSSKRTEGKMGAGGRRERDAVKEGTDGKGAIAEDIRQVEGVRGTTENNTTEEDTGKTHGEPRHGRSLPVGAGKAEENQQELSPPLLQPPRDTSLQHRAHLGLTGAVTPPLETPGWS